MKIPDINEANKLLEEGEKLNPGRWVSHAKYAGLAAKLISQKISGFNSEACYILGLLHDIGRRTGVKQMAHIIDGYNYMNGLGFTDAARISLTHSFPLKNIRTAISKWDCAKEEFDFVDNYINGIEYSDYDKLIQLCDYLALPSGFCIIEKRMVDIILRYQPNELTTNKFKELFKIKEYFESKIGCSIYKLLPDVVENTFDYNF